MAALPDIPVFLPDGRFAHRKDYEKDSDARPKTPEKIAAQKARTAKMRRAKKDRAKARKNQREADMQDLARDSILRAHPDNWNPPTT